MNSAAAVFGGAVEGRRPGLMNSAAVVVGGVFKGRRPGLMNSAAVVIGGKVEVDFGGRGPGLMNSAGAVVGEGTPFCLLCSPDNSREFALCMSDIMAKPAAQPKFSSSRFDAVAFWAKARLA